MLILPTDPTFQMEIQVKAGDDHYTFVDVPPGKYDLLIFGKAINNDNGTFQFPQLGKESTEIKEGESRQVDLGFGNESAPTTQPKP